MENKILEKDIQRQICEWLELKKFFFWRSNNIPVFGRSNDGTKRFRALPKYTPRGLPDIIVICAGKFYAIEVKRPGQKLRLEQSEFKIKCFKHGSNYITAFCLEDVIADFSHLAVYNDLHNEITD